MFAFGSWQGTAGSQRLELTVANVGTTGYHCKELPVPRGWNSWFPTWEPWVTIARNCRLPEVGTDGSQRGNQSTARCTATCTAPCTAPYTAPCTAPFTAPFTAPCTAPLRDFATAVWIALCTAPCTAPLPDFATAVWTAPCTAPCTAPWPKVRHRRPHL